MFLRNKTENHIRFMNKLTEDEWMSGRFSGFTSTFLHFVATDQQEGSRGETGSTREKNFTRICECFRDKSKRKDQVSEIRTLH